MQLILKMLANCVSMSKFMIKCNNAISKGNSLAHLAEILLRISSTDDSQHQFYVFLTPAWSICLSFPGKLFFRESPCGAIHWVTVRTCGGHSSFLMNSGVASSRWAWFTLLLCEGDPHC